MPVDSSATCVQPAARSQSTSRTSSPVVVPNVRTSWRRSSPRSPGARRQAVTLALCTSSPQHTAYRTSMASSLSAQGDEALTVRKILRVLSRGGTQQSGVPASAWVPIDDGLNGTNLQPTSTPSLHGAFVPSGGFSCAAGDPTGHGPIDGPWLHIRSELRRLLLERLQGIDLPCHGRRA